MNTTYTAADWKSHIAEFRQFGYDPYNSDDDAVCWYLCKEAGL